MCNSEQDAHCVLIHLVLAEHGDYLTGDILHITEILNQESKRSSCFLFLLVLTGQP